MKVYVKRLLMTILPWGLSGSVLKVLSLWQDLDSVPLWTPGRFPISPREGAIGLSTHHLIFLTAMFLAGTLVLVAAKPPATPSKHPNAQFISFGGHRTVWAGILSVQVALVSCLAT